MNHYSISILNKTRLYFIGYYKSHGIGIPIPCVYDI